MAVKKIAVAVATNPKILKTILLIILVIVVALITPFIALYAVFNGTMEFDKDKANSIASIDESQTQKIEKIEADLQKISELMGKKNFDDKRKTEAQVIYLMALADIDDDNIPKKLVLCFKAEQTDEELIEAVNGKFGTEILLQDYKTIMEDIRNKYEESKSDTSISESFL